MNNQKNKSPWAWIPTLYLAEGAPYFVVNTLAVMFLSQMGLSNAEVAALTGWLYLPWVIKPFWSYVLDLLGTKKSWVTGMQLLITLSLGGLGYSLNLDSWLTSCLIFLWLCAFSSATHDIAADGLYIISLNSNQQSFFVGIRNTFYRISTVLCQWAILKNVKRLYDEAVQPIIEEGSWNWDNCLELNALATKEAWQPNFWILAGIFAYFTIHHLYFLPKDSSKHNSNADYELENTAQGKSFTETIKYVANSIYENFKSFANKFTVKEFIIALLFIFTYRLGEAQLGKISMLFMKDKAENGGLGLDIGVVGDVYGLVGVIALTLGGIVGGIIVSKYGLRRMMFPMLLFMNIPNIVYVFLSVTQTTNMPTIYSMVALEQFGYGFGFTAFTLYLVYISQGEYSTTHYSICTGLMALGMMVPGIIAGYIQEAIGYTNFFVWVCICTIPPFIIAPLLKIDNDFGVKKEK